MRAAKVQASLRIRAVSPEPSLLAHTSSESRGTFRQKARSLAPLNGWACPVKICHDGMLEDTNSLDGAHLMIHKVTERSVNGFRFLSGLLRYQVGPYKHDSVSWTALKQAMALTLHNYRRSTLVRLSSMHNKFLRRIFI